MNYVPYLYVDAIRREICTRSAFPRLNQSRKSVQIAAERIWTAGCDARLGEPRAARTMPGGTGRETEMACARMYVRVRGGCDSLKDVLQPPRVAPMSSIP